MVKLAAFWEKVTAKGETYYACNLGGHSVLLLFHNKNKKSDNQPDLYLVVAEPKRKDPKNPTDSNRD